MQQKLFRIEQMVGHRRPQPAARPAPAPPREAGADDVAVLQHELAFLRDTFARHARELSALLNEGKERRMTRAAGELGAAAEAMEKATDKILQATEAIDDRARALTSAQMNDYERGLALDIQEQVVRICEACNFQDLSGQRIGKVIAILELIEERLGAVIEHSKFPAGAGRTPAAAPARALINGPRLDGDAGHASQHDVDALFG